MPELTIPAKLKPFLTKKKRFKIAFGGRGAAKSQTFADIFLLKSQTEQAKIGCFREMQNSIEDSVHSLLKEEVSRIDLQGFTIEKATIYNDQGGEFRFKGLARNPDAVKSMHGFKYFWIEEGQSISEDSLKMLTPTLRETDSELWVSMNPQSSEDPMSKRFLKPFEKELLRDGYYEDDLHLIVWVNYPDNPWFPFELEQERKWDFEHKSRAEYDHIWLGHYNDSIESSIIEAEWFDACIDAHLKIGFKARGARFAAHDPADSGDARAYAMRHGVVFLDVQENDKLDVNDACDWACDLASDQKVDRFIWDADGLGLTLKRQISQSFKDTRTKYQMFHGGGSVYDASEIYQKIGKEAGQQRTNEESFKNRRAQCYWDVRDRVYKTWQVINKKALYDADELISFSSGIKGLQKLRSELCRIPRKHNGAGVIQLYTKKEMKERFKVDSPNLADVVAMSFDKPATKKTPKSWNSPLPISTKGIV